MKKEQKERIILKNEPLCEGVFEMVIQGESMAEQACAGQFVSIYLNDKSRLLPRPISICEIDRTRGTLRLVYRTAGEGTRQLATYEPGETIKVLGPLGNGYTKKEDQAVLIGGGIGIPPMLELAKELECEKTIVLGYRDQNLFLKNDFQPFGTVVVATEDGSVGTKGNVLDAIDANGIKGSVIYACGPTPMLKGIQAYAARENIEAQISLEERMACGIGACLACVCQSENIDGHSYVHNKRVCKDGPVFDAKEVVFP